MSITFYVISALAVFIFSDLLAMTELLTDEDWNASV
jgi:hypothetical protein